jgi:flagellar hook assembly protein FlgD
VFEISELNPNKTHQVKLEVGNTRKYCYIDYFDIIEGKAVSIQDENDTRPTYFELSQNYPNPFNASTSIRFHLNKADHVKLEVYNMNGEKVKTLVNQRKGPGTYVSRWDGKNEYNRHVATGLYYCRLEYGSLTESKKMIYLK